MLDINATIQAIAVFILPLLFAITLHEAAHAYAARYFGDLTAWQMGRVSLNPLRHIDPIGTVFIPFASMLFSNGAFLFGYAKPTPINFDSLRHPKSDMFWVAVAGPFANLVMAFFWAALLKLAWFLPMNDFTVPLTEMSKAGITINCVLTLINLLPVPPLDGGRMVVSLLPHKLAWRFAQIERWSFLVFLVLLYFLYTGIFGAVMDPLVSSTARAIESIFGLY